jgi:uncharacterized cupredoxin-like copper-binding protein
VTEDRPPAESSRAAADGMPVPDLRQSAPPSTPRWVLALGLIAVALIVIFIVAQVLFGVQHGPGMHGSASDTDGATPTASAEVFDSSVGLPSDAGQAARRIELSALDTMTFEPASVVVSAGETITFVVTNDGQTAHEFTLGDAAMQQAHADAMAHMPGGMSHELPNSVRLEPGETKELTWRLGDAGTLEYACHEPDHYEAGMRGTINVG